MPLSSSCGGVLASGDPDNPFPIGVLPVVRHIFSGGDGILYAILDNGDLLWQRHDGRDDGSFRWAHSHGRKVGVGWNFKTVFSGGDGIIYAISETNDLLWFRHDGRDDGTFRWADSNARKVGVGWDFQTVFSGDDGVISGNCNGTCTASGTLSMNGNTAVSEQAMKALNGAAGWLKNPGLEAINALHKDANGNLQINFNGYSPTDNAFLGSTHVPVSSGPGDGVGFHVDSGYAFQDAYQFTAHVASIMHTFAHTLSGADK